MGLAKRKRETETPQNFQRRGRMAGALAAMLCLVALRAGAQTSSDPTSFNPSSTPAASSAAQAQQTSAPQASQTATPRNTGQDAGSHSAADSGQLSNLRPALTDSIWLQRGKPVAAIQFEGVTFSATDPLLGQLEQKQGAPLDPDKVRADMRRLFSSGKYRDISVGGTTDAGGITLIYAGVPRFYVGRVAIAGIPSERLAGLLEYATKLDPGTAYTEAQEPAAIDGVKQSLAQNGFYEPKVVLTTTKDAAGQQVNFNFNISQGPQARVGQVVSEGSDTGFDSQEDFRNKAALRCGRLARTIRKGCEPKVTRETTSNALGNLRSVYQKHQRLEGTVSVQKQTYSPARKQLDYDFAANQGPVVKVVIVGAKIANSRKKLLIPIYEESAVDNDLINEGAHNIREFLQQQGYFDVQCKSDLIGAGTKTVTVQYTVDKGQRYSVRSVSIKGNKYFNTDTLTERLVVKKGDLYQRAGKYSQSLVAQDVASTEALYRANGFRKTTVTSAVKTVNNAKAKKGEIDVTYTVVEGPQQKFGRVTIAGEDANRAKILTDMLQSEEDQPFSLQTLSDDRDSLLQYYVTNGFDQARVEVKQDNESENGNATDVVFAISEGQQVTIDQVLISGREKTRMKLVNSQLLVHAGDPLDQAALLETQRNLYNLALFNEVNAAVQNPTGDAPRKNVLVQLTEAKRWDVTYGAGFEVQTGTPAVVPGSTRGSTAAQNGKAGVSPRVSVDISRINLLGTDKSLTLHTTYGLLERVATLTLTNPRFFGRPQYTGSVSAGYSNVQNISTFAASTIQFDGRITQKFRKADNFIYDLQFRRVQVDPNSLEITPNLIPLQSQSVRVAGPAVTWFHDTRDPSPLDAGRGRFFSIQDFLANSKIGSQTDFNRVDVSYSTYYTFGKKKYVFARNTRIGFENTFGSTTNSTVNTSPACTPALVALNPTCNPVPLPERLYAGGATSHRGFGINDAGPRDLTTGYPVGGSAAVVNSFELRLPPPTLPVVGDSVSFVLFHDMGNVFQHPGDMFSSIKNFSQPNKASCENVSAPPIPPGQSPTTYYSSLIGTCSFNYYSHAVGVGARYKTPVGPIRVDFSYNLNPTKYPVFYDYTGKPPYVGSTPHFNFFFSIGQSF